MTVTRTDVNQLFDRSGKLVAETVEEVDVTAEAVECDLHAQARAALESNRDYLARVGPTSRLEEVVRQ